MSQSEQKEKIMKYRLAYTGLVLFVYIFGKNIPLYGIDISAYSDRAASAEDVLIQTISGDAYRSSIFALGIFPFMISSILVQIGFAVRGLFSKTRISPKTMGRISAMATFIIAVLQAVSQVPGLEFAVGKEMLPVARTVAVMEMVTGVMVIMWLSDRNGKYGVGGRMILGLVNILERITATVMGHDMRSLRIPLAVSIAVMLVTIIMENAEMRIPVQRVSIHNIYADKNYMAVKLNPVGVMPVMFSTAVFMLPRLLVFLLGYLFPRNSGIAWWQENMTLTEPAGIAVYIACEYLLTIAFAFIMISPGDIAEQFLKNGDSIINIHAGRDTKRYLRKVMFCISFVSATVMGVCLLVPLVLQLKGNIDSTLTMLPTSVMMMVSFWSTIFREMAAIYKYDACRPLF